jgi:hypothetical protein
MISFSSGNSAVDSRRCKSNPCPTRNGSTGAAPSTVASARARIARRVPIGLDADVVVVVPARADRAARVVVVVVIIAIVAIVVVGSAPSRCAGASGSARRGVVYPNASSVFGFFFQRQSRIRRDRRATFFTCARIISTLGARVTRMARLPHDDAIRSRRRRRDSFATTTTTSDERRATSDRENRWRCSA